MSQDWLFGFGIRITHKESKASVVIDSQKDQRLNYLLALGALRDHTSFADWWQKESLDFSTLDPFEPKNIIVEYFDNTAQTWKEK